MDRRRKEGSLYKYNKISGIYKIINLINGKLYIGSALNFYHRWMVHLSRLRKNKHHSLHLQAAWNVYGKESFKFEVIEVLENPTKELLYSREQYYIDLYNTSDQEVGYNLCKVAGSRMGIPAPSKDNWKKRVSEEEVITYYLEGNSQNACVKHFKICKLVLIRFLREKGIIRTRSEAHNTPQALKIHSKLKLGIPSKRKGIRVLITKICPNCSTSFSRWPSEAKKTTCCSTKCGYIYREKVKHK